MRLMKQGIFKALQEEVWSIQYSLDEPRNLDTRESGKEKWLKILILTTITISVSSAYAQK